MAKIYGVPSRKISDALAVAIDEADAMSLAHVCGLQWAV
jgi:hypothetical protein